MRVRALFFALFVLVLFSMPGLAGGSRGVDPAAASPVLQPPVTEPWLRAC